MLATGAPSLNLSKFQKNASNTFFTVFHCIANDAQAASEGTINGLTTPSIYRKA
jgi:hypothetical protein